MKKAQQFFWEGLNHIDFSDKQKNSEVVEVLKSAASLWRDSNKHFSAGFSMSRAAMYKWQNQQDSFDYSISAIKDYNNCVENDASSLLEKISALNNWIQELNQIIPMLIDSINAKNIVTELRGELAQRLVKYYENSPNAESYLVKGFYIRTDLEDYWEALFSPYEVRPGSQSWFNGILNMSLPSAFSLFLSAADYQGAKNIIDRLSNTFDSFGLKGWRAVVEGFADHQETAEKFLEAANMFALDTHPGAQELTKARGWWDSTNKDLWAKYFRSRSELLFALKNPNQVRKHIIEAAKCLETTNSGWVDGNVSRFRILIQTLAALVSSESIESAEQIKKQFEKIKIISGEVEEDVITSQFLSLSFQALEGFRVDPSKEILSGRLGLALDALSRIPIIGHNIVRIVTPVIGDNALKEILGSHRTWIHKTLEKIKDENQVLQKIILRLLQASLPLYAQIRQGPLEYGKDIVVLIEENNETVLRMYQVKCGDITTPKWREARSELEEAFLVSLPDLQISKQIDRHEVILICNGHAKPNVEPIMDGWFKEQARIYGRVFQFIHLDNFVTWIINERLINEFKVALLELNQPLVIED